MTIQQQEVNQRPRSSQELKLKTVHQTGGILESQMAPDVPRLVARIEVARSTVEAAQLSIGLGSHDCPPAHASNGS